MIDQNEHSLTSQSMAPELAKRPGRAMLSRNVRIHNRRTSVRLEPAMWTALNEIAAAENCSIHDLCGAVHDLKAEDLSFTAALRVFLMEYYRTAASVSPQVSSVQKRLKEPGRPPHRPAHKAAG
jgi:predicted DNA-binding ribbon-helix-helix protein